MCLDTCKRGVLAGCMPTIILNGHLLKERYKCQYFTEVKVDSNDRIFHIVYVVVDMESRQIWTRFLHLNIENYGQCNFMANKKKDKYNFIISYFYVD